MKQDSISSELVSFLTHFIASAHAIICNLYSQKLISFLNLELLDKDNFVFYWTLFVNNQNGRSWLETSVSDTVALKMSK